MMPPFAAAAAAYFMLHCRHTLRATTGFDATPIRYYAPADILAAKIFAAADRY